MVRAGSPSPTPDIAWIQSLSFTVTKEPELTGVEVRTVIVNLRAAPIPAAPILPAPRPPNCNNVDVVCRQIQEKIRVRNDAVL